MTDLEKALTVLQGMASADPALATRHIDPHRYVEHNPLAGDGIKGLRAYVEELAADRPVLKVIRAYQDGAWVVTQADGHLRGKGVFFDVFRFEDGLIVEHWSFAAEAGLPNQSGHTQVDGPTEARHLEDTQKNKALLREYYESVHLAGRYDLVPQYFRGDHCVRHEPGVADGVEAFRRDLSFLTQDRTIDAIELLFGEGDFVFLVARGTHRSEPCVYVDLYRIEDDKIVEHWGFPQATPISI